MILSTVPLFTHVTLFLRGGKYEEEMMCEKDTLHLDFNSLNQFTLRGKSLNELLVNYFLHIDWSFQAKLLSTDNLWVQEAT